MPEGTPGSVGATPASSAAVAITFEIKVNLSFEERRMLDVSELICTKQNKLEQTYAQDQACPTSIA